MSEVNLRLNAKHKPKAGDKLSRMAKEGRIGIRSCGMAEAGIRKHFAQKRQADMANRKAKALKQAA